jgi:DNA-binding protein YbaB
MIVTAAVRHDHRPGRPDWPALTTVTRVNPFATGPDEAEQWIDAWSAGVSERARAAQEMSLRVSALTVTAVGRDGAVEVTVGGSGTITDLRLDDRVTRWPARELAAEVLATMRKAQASLTGKVAEIAAATVGADSETGRAVVDGFAQRFPVVDPSAEEDRHAR